MTIELNIAARGAANCKGGGRLIRRRLADARRREAAAKPVQAAEAFSRNLMASPTVTVVSAESSGISTPNSSSKAMTSSTVSSESAPRSSIKLALSVTLSASTPRCSTTIFFTRSATSLICSYPRSVEIFVETGPLSLARRILREQIERYVSATSGGLVTHLRHDCERCARAAARLRKGPASCSNHCQSAIHMEGLAGDVSGLGAGQKHNRCGDIFAAAKSSCRHVCQNRFPLLVVQSIGHRTGNKTRRDTIGGH